MDKNEVMRFLDRERKKFEFYLSKNLPSHEDAQDGLQNVIVSSLEFSPRIINDKKLPSVAWKITKGVRAGYFRDPDNHKNANIPVVYSEEPRYAIEIGLKEDEGNRPDEVAQRKEIVSFVRKFLKPQLARIFIMRYYEQQSLGEISESLKISLATVKRKLSEAHDKLSETTERLGIKSCMFI